MSVIVFCGPTLKEDEVRAVLDAEVRPPAGRGDILRAALARPAAIGLVDGYFARVPAVWHKEILWAMSQGIHVFGAASMGALRAAELSAFGMEGVGRIFEAFQLGELTDDDEVAIVHAERDRGYRSLSEAMVNIRATVAAAVEARVMDAGAGARLLAVMKALPYPERTLARLLEREGPALLATAPLEALRAWLPRGRIDQKRADALALLAVMAERARAGWQHKRVGFRFASTDAWESLYTTIANEFHAGVDRDAAGADAVVDELLIGGRADAALNGAIVRALSLALARHLGLKPDDRAVAAVVEDFRRERGLLDAQSFERWIARSGLADDQLDQYFRREAIVRRMKEAVSRELVGNLADHLRGTDEYQAATSGAAAKASHLEQRGLAEPTLEDARLSEDELWRWYFEQHLLRCPAPTAESFARAQGMPLDRLRAAVLREYLHRVRR